MLGVQSGKRPLVFGEVLFDSFSDGSMVLGGAPFNVAWHLQGFGLAPLLVSRVGNDALGQQILNTMSSWGMDTRGVQTDMSYPTGTVTIKLTEGQPSFAILAEQAYDYIDMAMAEAVLEQQDVALLYHGSLALRQAVSRNTLVRIREARHYPVFVDVNLREPWWSRQDLADMLQGADWVKLNDDELSLLMDCTVSSEQELRQLAESFKSQHKLDLLILTRGAAGAWLLDGSNWIYGDPVIVDNVVDTVGAGDAFSAVTLLGLLLGWELASILPRALEFAAQICRTRGATIDDKSQYQRILAQWSAP